MEPIRKRYAVVSQTGYIYEHSLSTNKWITIDRFLHSQNHLYNRKHWQKMRKEGYTVKCFDVSITEIN